VVVMLFEPLFAFHGSRQDSCLTISIVTSNIHTSICGEHRKCGPSACHHWKAG
jgi:hypothetical protein